MVASHNHPHPNTGAPGRIAFRRCRQPDDLHLCQSRSCPLPLLRSAPCIRGAPDERLGSVTRVPAADIEAAISKAVIAHAKIESVPAAGSTLTREAMKSAVAKIEVRKSQLAIHLKGDDSHHDDGRDGIDQMSAKRIVLIPWKKPTRPVRAILLPANTPAHRARPMKAERRSALIRSVGRGREWLKDIIDGKSTIEGLAAKQKCSIRQINMTISLAFLAPALVTAAVEGRFPRGIGVERLRDPPTEWSRQFEALDLNLA